MDKEKQSSWSDSVKGALSTVGGYTKEAFLSLGSAALSSGSDLLVSAADAAAKRAKGVGAVVKKGASNVAETLRDGLLRTSLDSLREVFDTGAAVLKTMANPVAAEAFCQKSASSKASASTTESHGNSSQNKPGQS